MTWGSTRWNRTATAYTPLRLPGQYEDSETGQHYNSLRHYDPETARYANPDPLGPAPAANPVAYVTNPWTLTDPLGLIAKGCTEDGGWYGGMTPANLKDENDKPKYPVKMEINHIPAKASHAPPRRGGFITTTPAWARRSAWRRPTTGTCPRPAPGCPPSSAVRASAPTSTRDAGIWP